MVFCLLGGNSSSLYIGIVLEGIRLNFALNLFNFSTTATSARLLSVMVLRALSEYNS